MTFEERIKEIRATLSAQAEEVQYDDMMLIQRIGICKMLSGSICWLNELEGDLSPSKRRGE